jgi:anthranilate synthase/aminodeoxychorismate synthase-like glutamine amidotransferase
LLLIIDNYDSFTWNLVQRIGELDPDIDMRVVRNDHITAGEARALNPTHIVISPGPCTPAEAGVSRDIVQTLGGVIPILGVCLGHQCIGDRNGMLVTRHARIVHGKTSQIHHEGVGLYEGLPNPFTATRYHSLVVTRDSVPDSGWAVSAWTTDTLDDGSTTEVVMGLRQISDNPDHAPLLGVQYHPESFLTTDGPLLLANFLGLPRPAPAMQ